MARTERNFEETLRNLKRDTTMNKRNAQASLAVQISRETQQIKDSIDEINIDARLPAAPIELVLDQFPVRNYNPKYHLSRITVTFPPVTRATDGTDMTIGGYEMWVREQVEAGQEEDQFQFHSASLTPSLVSQNVEQGRVYEVVVRSTTIGGRPGPFSEIRSIDVTGDDAPPPIPAQLILTQRLGTVTAAWNGLSFADEPMPADFFRTELGIKKGAETDFTPIPEYIEGAGEAYYAGAPFNEPIQIAHRSEDYAGNKSAWSLPSTITVAPVVDDAEIQRQIEEIQGKLDQTSNELVTTRQELNTKLDQAQVDIDAAESSLNDLNTITIPAMDQQIADARQQITDASAELNGKIDTATSELAEHETRIGANETSLTDLNTVKLPALQQELDNAETQLGGIDQRLTDAQNQIDSATAELDGRLDQAFIDIGLNKTALEANSARIADIIATAGNLVSNADFELDAGWAAGNGTRGYSTDIARSGVRSMKLSTTTINSYVESQYVSTTTGRIYFMEAYVRRGAGTEGNDNAGFIVRRELPDKQTVTATSASIAVKNIPTDSWVRIGWTFQIPVGTDAVQVRFGPWKSTGSDMPVYFDDFRVYDITEAFAANQTASEALNMAGTKNAVYYSTADPSGSGTRVGDLWRKRGGSGGQEIIGEWQWSGSAWVAQTVSGTIVSNMDVGYLTAGSAAISTAVIDKLWAQVITARKISASQVAIGSFDNLVPDPKFTDSAKDWAMSGVYSTDPTGGRDGGTAFKIAPAAAAQAGKYSAWVTAEPEAVYKVSVWVKGTEAIPVGGVSIYCRITRNVTGTISTARVVDNTAAIPANTWAKLEGEWTVPADAKEMGFGAFRQTTSGFAPLWFDTLTATRKSDGSLVVNGSITGDHLEVSTVAAKVATVISLNASRITSGTIATARLDTDAIAAATAAIQKADIKNLTVSNGTFSAAVIDKLWADVITARKISANQVLIGQGANLVPWPFNDGTYVDNDLAVGFKNYTHASNPVRVSDNSPRIPGEKYIFTTYEDTAGSSRLIIEWSRELASGLHGWDAITGDKFLASCFVNTTSTNTLYLSIYFYKADGSYINSINGTGVSVGATWAEITAEATAPAGAAFVRVYVRAANTAVTASKTLRMTMPSLRKKVDGSLIVDGTITGEHINASSVSAKVASVIQLDVSRLVASTATMNSAVITKLWADVVNSKKITSEMVLIGAGSNLYADPHFTNAELNVVRKDYANSTTSSGGDSGWYWTGSYWYSKLNPLDGNHLFSTRNTITGNIHDDITIEPGATYRLRVEGYIAGTGSSGTIRFAGRVKKRDGTGRYIGLTLTQTMSSGWAYYEGEFTFAADDISCGLEVQFLAIKSATRLALRDISMVEMAGGSLIVDGAITATKIGALAVTTAKLAADAVNADKLAANSVTAASIATGAITATKIAGGAIDGKVITGATVRTSSTSTRIELSGTTLRAMTDGTEFFKLDPVTGTAWMWGSFQAGASNGLNDYHINVGQSGGTPSITMGKNSGSSLSGILPTSSGAQYVAMGKVGTAFEPNYGFILDAKTAKGGIAGGYSLFYYDAYSEYGLNYDNNTIWRGISYIHNATTNPPYLLMYESHQTAKIPSFTNGTSLVLDISGGTRKVGLQSSLSRYKLNQQVIPESYDDKLLSVEAKLWFDRTQAEEVSRLMTPMTLEQSIDQMTPIKDHEKDDRAIILRRVPGVIAEDVEAAGLEEFLVRDGDGVMIGVQYDRLGVALIPIVRRQRDRIRNLESDMEELLARVESLESGTV